MADSTRVLDVPVLDEDPFDPGLLVDPYGFYERVRDAGPVVFLERYGVWAMGRHSEVAHVLGDWETFSSARGWAWPTSARKRRGGRRACCWRPTRRRTPRCASRCCIS